MTVSTRSTPRGLGEYLAVLEQRLAALPVDDLRAALVAHAERLPVRDREAFLAIFPAPSAMVSQVPGRRAVPSPDGTRLLADIDAFVDRVRSGAFFEGWGWDDDLHEERAWGDESWVGEMDELFAVAADAFLDGDLALARDAYGRLLGAFDLDQEVGTFCGPSIPSDMVATDVPEAVARYLRAVCETTPLSERAEELYDRYADLGHLAPATSLHTIADTRRSGLPDLDDFLPAWIEVLTEHTSGSWARDRQRLLTEATVWHAGTDGLATVARRPGDHQPTAYLDWIDALTHDGRLDDAAAAAREAMTITGLPAERSAEVADRLGDLTARLGDRAAALDARRTAWRTHRTRSRLLTLVVATDAAGQRIGTLEAEADLVLAAPDRLGCELLLLADRIDAAATALVASDPLGWSSPGHPGPVVWPFLLAAAVAPVVPAAETQLGRQFAAIDTADRWHGYSSLDRHDSDADRPSPAPPRLSSLLAFHIADRPGSAQQRQQWLDAARSVADRRIDAVVGNKHRGAYQRVAALGVAYAEALALAADQAAGAAFITATRSRHPRHVAFRDELDRATAASSLLPAPPQRRR
ncbi:hypothetical protein KZZ52_53790 [Dactylosporangium sp. AC04546]|uniref:hypothetical protein n=1 Tax=Dactylosporangium sp. AC04546 TaxID=2862460 RepID=UPI001EE14FE2|nr:hypothetical protein [Dactylosporangium sp. AC04546]WVK82728.1 hypothetical protein KZZ52_53790 [Dactylosporangium sp. AC04546]